MGKTIIKKISHCGKNREQALTCLAMGRKNDPTIRTGRDGAANDRRPCARHLPLNRPRGLTVKSRYGGSSTLLDFLTHEHHIGPPATAGGCECRRGSAAIRRMDERMALDRRNGRRERQSVCGAVDARFHAAAGGMPQFAEQLAKQFTQSLGPQFGQSFTSSFTPSFAGMKMPSAAIPPERLQQLQADYSREAMQLFQQAIQASSAMPELKDRRFSAEAWKTTPIYAYTAAWYLPECALSAGTGRRARNRSEDPRAHSLRCSAVDRGGFAQQLLRAESGGAEDAAR